MWLPLAWGPICASLNDISPFVLRSEKSELKGLPFHVNILFMVHFGEQLKHIISIT